MTKSRPSAFLFGKGIYSYTEASIYVGAPAAALRRWVSARPQANPPATTSDETLARCLWYSELSNLTRNAISFRDLIELRFVAALRAAGMPLSVIRATRDMARQRWSASFPLSTDRFRKHGLTLCAEAFDAAGQSGIFVARQAAVRSVIGRSLRAGVELDEHDVAVRWYPMKNSRAVVLDPARKFGDAILSESGVPTAAMAGSVVAEGGDEKRVARMFEVTIGAVRKAVEFEARRSIR